MNKEKFIYHQNFFGGTETMARGIHAKILPYTDRLDNFNCYILPGITPNIALLPNYGAKIFGDDSKRYIFWMHNLINQFASYKELYLLFQDSNFVNNKLQNIIVVSNYQKQIFLDEVENLKNNPEKVVVLENAINPLTPNPDKFNNIDKIKLVYISSPDRGLPLLLESLEYVDEDFELEIFGNFYPDIPQDWLTDMFDKPILQKMINDDRIVIYGNTPKKTVHRALSNAHIFAYPPTWFKETSCISLIEAMSAGCYPVITDSGALKETSLGYGLMLDNTTLTPEIYGKALNQKIKDIKQNGYNYTKQVEDTNNQFSWDAIVKKWFDYLEQLPIV